MDTPVMARPVESKGPWLRALLDEVNRVFAKRMSVRVEHLVPHGARVVVEDPTWCQWPLVNVYHRDTEVCVQAAYEALRAMPDAAQEESSKR